MPQKLIHLDGSTVTALEAVKNLKRRLKEELTEHPGDSHLAAATLEVQDALDHLVIAERAIKRVSTPSVKAPPQRSL